MGSKKKRDTRVSAYGTLMQPSEKAKIDNHNASEKQIGANKDANYVAERQAVAQKSGTVEYKSFVKKHLNELGNILGVKR